MWTIEDNATLARMWSEGASDEEISETLERTVSAIKSRANRLSLGMRDRTISARPNIDGKKPWTAAEDARLLEMRRSARKWVDIAQALGRSHSAVICRETKLADKARVSTSRRMMRSCLGRTCRGQVKFMSENPGNRLCYRCSLDSGDARSQYD